MLAGGPRSRHQPNILSADNDEVLGHEVDVHPRRVGEKWIVMNSQQSGALYPQNPNTKVLPIPSSN